MSNLIDIRSKPLYRIAMQGRWDWVNRGVGERVAQARKRARLTQKALADRVEMSRASIANIEAGKQGVQIQMVFELAEQLQISPSDLIPVFNDSGNLRDLSEVQTLQLIRRQLAASQ